jgi:pimeloyl-ACP methyl ester carboxylesterase
MITAAIAFGTAHCGEPEGHESSGSGASPIALDADHRRGDAGGRCGAVPADVERRFDAMRGPLGCSPSVTMVDPPGGCDGADAFVADLRAEYAKLWAASDCTTTPPSLAPYVSAYDRAFAARHAFVPHRIARGPFTIAAREFGAEHAGDGPTIVLMHGFPDDQHLYDLVAPELGRRRRTITFDFVGWGDSSVPPPDHAFTFDGLRADLEAVLAHFHADDVVPVVHDASGWPGIDWALDHPDAVKALVLLNTAYFPVPGQAPPYVIRALAVPDLRPAFIEAAGSDDLMQRALLRAQVSRFFDDAHRREVFLPLFERFIPTSRAGIFGLTATLLQASRDRLANVPRMQAFPRPVAVTFGADDPYLNTAVATAFASTFSRSRLELVARAGHYVQLDQPEAVVAAIEGAADGR